MEAEVLIETKEKKYSLSGGDIFKQHPEKVLAEPYEASGAFGPVTKYRPKENMSIIDTLQEIKTPEFVSHGTIDLSPARSVISGDQEALPDQNEELMLEKSEADTIKKQARTRKQKYISWAEPEQKDVLSFQEVLKTYNPHLTQDEIIVFLWYMHTIGNTFKGQWLNLYNPAIIKNVDESLMIKSWAKQGLLLYFQGKFLPKSIYLSGNLYEKKSFFEKEKEEIASAYGQEVADKQEEVINAAFKEIYDKRLKLDNPDESKRLRIKPFSEFAKSVNIKNWELDNRTGQPAEFVVIMMGSEKKYGEIHWYSRQTSVSSYRSGSQKHDELSLADAYRYWLKWSDKSPQLPYNLNWEDIFKYYLDKKAVKNVDQTEVAKKRAICKEVGDKFFGKFLAEIINENDRVKIEIKWNELYNSNLTIDYDKIPIGFSCAKKYPKQADMEIKAEKREAVSFHTLTGSSLLAYGVGYGKTWAAIFTIAQAMEAGHCKRAVIIVPNQVYRQFMSEVKGILPNKKIYDLYNLGEDYISQLYDEHRNVQMVDEGSITMLTYQGFERIGFSQSTIDRMLFQLSDAISMLQEMDMSGKAGQKAAVKEEEKMGNIIGKALAKSIVTVEELGFDFVCFDEAHALKKIFSQVKARKAEEEGTRGKKMYEISAGTPSNRGVKGYFLCSYIQMENKGKNILLLTATPFTNSPLEVYSMLSLVAYQYMRTVNLSNINDFFDNFCQMSHELIINSRLQPERKQIFKGFDNLIGLQKLIYKFMLYKEAEKMDAKGNMLSIDRPDKWVLPYKGRLVKNKYIAAGPDEAIDTVLPLTETQKKLMDFIIQYVEEKMSYEQLNELGIAADKDLDFDMGDEDEDALSALETTILEEGNLDDEEKKGVRVLRGVNLARAVALSPYLAYGRLGRPTYKTYIEESPKLSYIMQCIKSVREYHEKHNEPISGIIIYMDRGKKYFELIKEYLIHELNYKPNEVGIVRSGKEGTAKHKENVKNLFNGLQFNEALRSFEAIPDEDRIKIIIGTGSIKEGMNLQAYTTVLFNAFVDWNPTDQLQLEGRAWRQGNTFANVRIVIPLMADSMDIFMFQKLEEKTSRINSIWNYDGQTNVLPVEELDPRDQKLALVTNPRVIAELHVENDIARIQEDITGFEANIIQSHNIIDFIETRDKFAKELIKLMKLIAPDKAGASIEVMAKTFESALETGKVGETPVKNLIPITASTYDYEFLDYYKKLTKPWNYGKMKGSVAMIKKAKFSFLDRKGISDNAQSIEEYVNNENAKIGKARKQIEFLQSDKYLDERASEIEQERKEKKITFVSVEKRVKEFETLNRLLSIKAERKADKITKSDKEEVEGCPPMTETGERDISPEAIRRLEHCLEIVPQTKALHTDENGNYTPERQKLHSLIKNRLHEKATCVNTPPQVPIAIFTGGVPGSGKTTFLKKYAPFISEKRIFTIDADAIREELPEYKGWNSKATHLEARDIYMSLLDEIGQGKPCIYDILWDGTMNKAQNYKPLIGKLHDLGYKIYAIYVNVPGEVSRERVLTRYQKHGRYVPLEVVNEAIDNGTKGFNEIKALIEGYMLIDGISGELIEKGGEQLIEGRGYFDQPAKGNEGKIKKAKAIATAQNQRVRLLTL